MKDFDDNTGRLGSVALGEDVSTSTVILAERQKIVHRLRVEIANLKSTNSELRVAHENERQRTAELEVRLAEVSADYRNALAAIKERGEAQATAIAAYQRMSEQVATLNNQLTHVQNELAEKEGQIQRLEAQEKQTALRLAEVSADYRNALAIIQERGEAQSQAILANQKLSEDVAVLNSQRTHVQNELAEKEGQIQRLEAQEKQTALRLAEVSADYQNALATIQERGEAQSAALAAYQKSAEAVAALQAQLAERDQGISAKESQIRQLEEVERQTSLRLAEVSADHNNALATAQERGEAHASTLAAYQSLVEEFATKTAVADHALALNRETQVSLQARESEIGRLKAELQQALLRVATLEAEQRVAREIEAILERTNEDLDRLRDKMAKVEQGLEATTGPEAGAVLDAVQRAQPYLTPIAVENLRQRNLKL